MKKVLCGALLITLGTLISASASADDKVLPGLSCVKIDTYGYAGTPQIDSWGKMRNLHSVDSMRVLCPIVKDDVPWSVDLVRVRGLDATTVGQVVCSVVATSADHDAAFWSNSAYSGGYQNYLSAGWYDIAITPPGVQESGSVFVDCILPPTQASNPSSIVSIYWNET